MGRTVALIDMDCFYVQVEQRLDPSLKGKPCAVVQYNEWQGGGIIAVSYEARARGVTRFLRGDSAKKVCPEIELVRVPEVRGKADLTKYRTAGAEVIAVLCQFAKCVERASVDEAYIDLTEEVAEWRSSGKRASIDDLPNTYVAGYEIKEQRKQEQEKPDASAEDDGSSGGGQPATPVASDLSSSRARGLDDWLNRASAPTKRNVDPTAPVIAAATSAAATAACGRSTAAAERSVQRDESISVVYGAYRGKDVAAVTSFDEQDDDVPDTDCPADDDHENGEYNEEQDGEYNEEQDVEEQDDDEMDDLTIGAMLVEQMRAAVFDQTGFRCSAGIARNKVLAKLACGIHKPNKQTILPPSAVARVYAGVPLNKVRNLGGKLGKKLQKELGVNVMAELAALPRQRLEQAFGEKTGSWLHELSRGVDHEPVSVRHLPKSVGCSKNFRGKNCLDSGEKAAHWMQQLALEIEERLAKDLVDNKRRARLLNVHAVYADGRSLSRACPMPPDYAAPLIRANAMAALRRTYEGKKLWCPPIVSLGLAAGKFAAVDESGDGNLTKLFAAAADRKSSTSGAATAVPDCCSKDDSDSDSTTSFALLSDNEDGEQRDRDHHLGRLLPPDCADGGPAGPPQGDPPARADAVADVADVGAVRPRVRDHFTRAAPAPRTASTTNSSDGGVAESFFERRMRERGATATAASAAQPNGGFASKQPQPMARASARAAWPQPSVRDTGAAASAGASSALTGTSFGPARCTRCPRCGRLVAPEAQAEHDDYHMARDLQREWNSQVMAETASARQRERAAAPQQPPQRQTLTSSVTPVASATPSSSKRARQSDVTAKPAKTLLAYFRKA